MRAASMNNATVSATLTSCPRYSCPSALRGVRAGCKTLNVIYKLAATPVAAPASAETHESRPQTSSHTSATAAPAPVCTSRMRLASCRMSESLLVGTA